MTVLANGRCAVGNCYSLRKDHKSILKMFQKAILLNEISRYAHMLSGHEYNSFLFPSLLLVISTLTNQTQDCPSHLYLCSHVAV
ncbi:unnamed protein product [Brassica napus]|uniref:(rape) hypothetical protein n=1 Tax=Brassica napus TaxID=3708 RepID=A0A816K3Y5_BRANA|nr:unnamed protein product [Brassica napus]